MTHPVIDCAVCHRSLTHKARGLCSNCYQREAAEGRLDRYGPGRPNRRAEIAALLAEGLDTRTIAERLGVTVNAVHCANRDARRAEARRAARTIPTLDWHANAACAGLAVAGYDPWHPETSSRTANTALVAEAVAICRTCPVATDCLRWALDNPSLAHGIHGGLTAEQRANLARAAS